MRSYVGEEDNYLTPGIGIAVAVGAGVGSLWLKMVPSSQGVTHHDGMIGRNPDVQIQGRVQP